MSEQQNARTDSVEKPIAYRMSWEYTSDRLVATIRKGKRPPASQVFPTRDEAEFAQSMLKLQYGTDIVTCIVPMFIARTKREAKYDARQSSAATDWPLQIRPKS